MSLVSEEKKAESLKVGDVVRLNSNSPSMTVTHFTEYGAVGVTWAASGFVQRDIFPPEALTLM